MKKRVAVALATCMVVGSLTGCKSEGPTKEEIQNNLNVTSNLLTAEQEKNEELMRIIAGYNPSDKYAANLNEFYQMAVDEGAYLAFDSKINMANPIVITPVNEIQDQTSLALTDTVKFKPNQNWIVRAGSGHMEMSHSSGVYGEVDCYEYLGGVEASDVYEIYIEPHFEAIRGESVGVPTNVFTANGNLAGKQATCRLKVANLKSGELAVQTEEMTKAYDENAEIIPNGAEEGSGDSVETSEGADESVEEAESTSEESTEASESAEASTEEIEGSEESSEPNAGELTGEVVEQSEEDTVEIEDYLYTTAVAIYSVDGAPSQVIVFKFMYKEGDATDNATKAEFIGNTIKSFSINGNSLTLQ